MGPLEGIRVIDCTIWQQGPVATLMLGDLGAEVIKIEEPVKGDPGRAMMKITKAMTGAEGRNYYFESTNRNKKSMTLNLKENDGKEILYKLIKKSDVFVTNFSKTVNSRLGIDYKTLSQFNPRLIYAWANSWGPNGVDSDTPGYDYTAIARSGMMYVWGEPNSPPANGVGGIGDQVSGIITAYGILAGLFAREKMGIGQEINTSLLGSLISLQSMSINYRTILGENFPRAFRARAGNPLWNHYKCKDEKWIAIASIEADRYWHNFCEVLGIENLEKDERFENITIRSKHSENLISIVDKIFATKTQAEWLNDLQERGIICGPINTHSEVTNDPQALVNEYIVEFDHPVWRKIKTVGIPVNFSKTPGKIQAEAPELGRHTEEILQDILGFSADKIAILREHKTI